MSDGRVLVVDQDAQQGRTWRELLRFADFEPVVVASAEEGLQRGLDVEPCVAALVARAGGRHAEVAVQLHARDERLPIVTFGTEPEPPATQEICDDLCLPVKYSHLVESLARARRWRDGPRAERPTFPVGTSAAVTELETLMRQVAGYDSTILIQGESGSGKELVARRIHELSPRAEAPFVPVTCGAIPRELLESELFGHEKGAFTGAITRRIGRFALANGGTLFLDEIGDMSLEMQVKLLRVLQDRRVEPIGGKQAEHVDVRIIAATHRCLTQCVDAGEFREDLYFRLNVLPIHVPPLRERIEDLPALIDDLVQQGLRAGRPSIAFSRSAIRRLEDHRWPGNVRELQNLVERLSILRPDAVLEASELPLNPDARPAVANPAKLPSAGIDLREHLGNIEQQLIRSALERAGGTVAHAARLLKLQRTTLVEKLRKYELQIDSAA